MDSRRGRPDHDRRRGTARPGRGQSWPRRQLRDPVAVRRLLRPRDWTASARRSTTGSAPAPQPPRTRSAPARPAPVVLNTWEAVYFDHSLASRCSNSPNRPPGSAWNASSSTTAGSAAAATTTPAWATGTSTRISGPDGLTPLIEAVTGHGMEFGLWVEPEMVNLDSDVARAHPDWIAGPVRRRLQGRRPAAACEWRHQQVLDLVNPEAWQYIYDRARCPAAREPHQLPQMGPEPGPHRARPRRPPLRARPDAGRLPALRRAPAGPPGRRDRKLLLRRGPRGPRHPASAPTGSGPRTATTPWNGRPSSAGPAVVPPELVGSHIGPTTSHTTARTHDLSFRAITAMFGHFGIEWDVRQPRRCERTELRRAIALFKRTVPCCTAGARSARTSPTRPPAPRRRVPRRRRGPLCAGVRGDVVRRSPRAGLPAGA